MYIIALAFTPKLYRFCFILSCLLSQPAKLSTYTFKDAYSLTEDEPDHTYTDVSPKFTGEGVKMEQNPTYTGVCPMPPTTDESKSTKDAVHETSGDAIDEKLIWGEPKQASNNLID